MALYLIGCDPGRITDCMIQVYGARVQGDVGARLAGTAVWGGGIAACWAAGLSDTTEKDTFTLLTSSTSRMRITAESLSAEARMEKPIPSLWVLKATPAARICRS